MDSYPVILREVVESAEFEAARDSLGNVERLDEVLRAVYWAVSKNPEAYEVVPGLADVRLLKTDPLGGLPGFRIWFRLLGPAGPVELLLIEAFTPQE